MRQQENIQRFVDEIWQWYAKNKRTLPWRDLAIPDDTQRAYMILVSEVMLQQTQVSRVQILFPRFLQKFPTIHHLAKASNRDVLIAWRGMGYNSRALRLRDAARVIVGRCDGQCVTLSSSKGDTRTTCMVRRAHHDTLFPRSMEELTAITGIGPYTAAAIRNFAFGIPTPCVDVNIERILQRVFGVKGKKRVGERAGEVLRVALESDKRLAVSGQRRRLPAAHFPLAAPPSAAWHSALMDFGSLVCTKRSPRCAECPLSKGICCSAFQRHRITESLPPAASRQPPREPGRLVAGRFIPNRIIRGKIVDLLRDHPQGLTLVRIGQAICVDWSKEHRSWLRDILDGLLRDALVRQKEEGRCFLLGDDGGNSRLLPCQPCDSREASLPSNSRRIEESHQSLRQRTEKPNS